ncbi:MAG: inorganic phosphate transporter [Fibrobacterales bacterium]
MITIALFFAALFLAYSNGANDNFKGVATLFGTNSTNYKVAIRWATITTFLGSVTSIFLASALVKNFSGKGLVPVEILQTPEFGTSIALGAAITVLLATRIGMPISTTHGLVGALFGAGVVAVGMLFNFERLLSVFLFPLIVSPIMAAVVSLSIYLIIKKVRALKKHSTEVASNDCLCVGTGPSITSSGGGNALFFNESTPTLSYGSHAECAVPSEGTRLAITEESVLRFFHFISAGVVSFARGLNDTPKIVGLLLIVNAFNISYGMIAIALAMAIGGLLNARKVGETVSKKITSMSNGQGFTANLVTGLLVTTASIHGMPVSTTHVSVGSIFGISTVSKKVDLTVIRNIVFSWIMTLPIAALISGLCYYLISMIF